MIYKDCIQCDSLTAKGRLGASLEIEAYFEEVPSLAIESVCRKLNNDVKQLRSHLWPRKLHFDVADVSKSVITMVGTSDKYKWLHDHIHHISLNAYYLLGHNPNYKFRNLQHLAVFLGKPWLPYGTYASLEELQGDIETWKHIWGVRASSAERQVTLLSGGNVREFSMTLVQKVQLRSSKCKVKVVSNTGFLRAALKD